MSPVHSLPQIVALARLGATDRAWAALVELERTGGGIAPSGLKGRLLKAFAEGRAGAERQSLFREAAAAYAAAYDGISTYPLINAATSALLGGDAVRACDHARRVLELIEARPEEPETPYWRAATLAEALLLLDRHEDAHAAFAEAIALAPLAWEDHASTLRQFALILEAQGKDAAWLDAYRPPQSLHFGGHMSFDAAVVRREHLEEKIAVILDEEKVGFGYGALAAGADIIIAEALVGRGAELHAVLPGGAEAFATVSVDPFGKAWRRRFEALLAKAATVRPVAPFEAEPDRMMIGLADEIAMGAAVMNARRLESRALQLLVLPADADPGDEPAHAHGRWADAGWRQRIILAPRERAQDSEQRRLPVAPHSRLALVTVAAGPAEGMNLAALAAALREGPAPALAPYFTGRETVVGYADVADAARIALRLSRLAGGKSGIGGHYGVADPVEDPFSGGVRLAGEPAALAAAAAASAPQGAVCVTADFAAALAASGEVDLRVELVGELNDAGGGGAPIELFALKQLL